MLRFRELVGRDYLVQAVTHLGAMQRWMMAFDRDDARDQVREYCRAEGLVLLEIGVR